MVGRVLPTWQTLSLCIARTKIFQLLSTRFTTPDDTTKVCFEHELTSAIYGYVVGRLLLLGHCPNTELHQVFKYCLNMFIN